MARVLRTVSLECQGKNSQQFLRWLALKADGRIAMVESAGEDNTTWEETDLGNGKTGLRCSGSDLVKCWLYGRTKAGEVVADAGRDPQVRDGLWWTIRDNGDGTVSLACEAKAESLRWLDGHTVDGSVHLVSMDDTWKSGTRWRAVEKQARSGAPAPTPHGSEEPDDIERRFAVGLSFSGDRRDYIREVAKTLATELGEEKVLFDDTTYAALLA